MREIVRARHVLLEFNGRDVLNISELSVAENERIGLIGASRSGAPRPLQKPHRGFCDTGLRVPDRKTKTAPWGRFFVLVPEVGLCASRAVGLRSAQRLCRSGAPRPLQKPHRGFCDTGLRVPDRKTKTAPLGRPLFWCRKWDSNPHGGLAQRILSPPRLPIPSFRQAAISARSAHSVYFNIPARELQARRSVFHYFSPWRLCAILINKRVLRHQGRALYGDGSFAF